MTTKSMFMGFGLLLLGACASERLGGSSAAVSGSGRGDSTAADVAGVGDLCEIDSDCPNNLECDDGACKQHGGGAEDANDANDDHGAGHDAGDDHGNDGGNHGGGGHDDGAGHH